ncbi:MAG: ABC transporter permease [Lachnospiraceae bacterium]
MRITAKLAYSQIKVKRSRTIWTLIGIGLSTALITAVCSFAASGNALFADLYGEAYVQSIGRYTAMLLIPAAILSAIIVSMTVVVISNAFRVSASERRAQFGILKSVGTTKQQITATVMYESIFLSAVGIPIGIIVGLVIAFVGVQVANYYLGNLSSLVNLMIREFSIVVDFVISWQAILAAVFISFFAVLLSAWLPARKVAKVSAIDSIRKFGDIKIAASQMRTNRLVEKVFGFEGALAAKNIKRSKRNLRASVISLTIGIVLFISLSAINGQLEAIVDIMYSNSNADVIVDYNSSIDDIVNDTTGKEETIIAAPIDNETADAITVKLREYEDAAVFGTGNNRYTYTALIPSDMISSEMKEAVFSEEEAATYEIPVEIITVDSENYKSLCKQAGVPVGSNILINHYSHNDNGNAVTIAPFLFEGQSLQLIKADGSTSEIEVHGELKQESVPADLLYINTEIVRLIVPGGEMRGFSWNVSTADPDGFMDYANTVMSEAYPGQGDASYMELGFTTRVFEMHDYVKVMNLAINLVMVFVYCFVVLLALIGLTSVISTMSANVQMRSREFAVLQSVGITPEGLKRMLNLESIMCSVKAMSIGLPLAILLTYLINIPIRSMFPVPYQFPWLAVGCCIVAVFAITWATMRYSSTRLQKKNIVETIRLEN